ncbi:bifunctional DNA primase/polymerase [Bradyrhizobium sp. 604_D8_N2_3]|uniref:bifunctional DNA primase/polymerase n=1 Tax=Bradyrhizobium sp. 604_D8_N2_3 TaxID=3240370 RepID=UPI003F2261CD
MTTAVEAARAYIARGWNPVPIPFKSKKPNGDGWQERVIGEADVQKYFKGKEQNVGVVLGPSSNDLTDLDLDCSEAIALASHALPRTSAMFGRASAPASHWLYQTKLASTSSEQKAVFVFNDPMRPKDDARLLEVRVGGFKGAQTVFPGSVHMWTAPDLQGLARAACSDRLRSYVRPIIGSCDHWPRWASRTVSSKHESGICCR